MPKCSVFTPTHNPYRLLHAYQSLVGQTFRDWEWIIVPNNGVTVDAIWTALLGKRDLCNVKILPHESKSIGELKHFAASQGTGEILVELDHDDELAPNCCEELVNVFQDPTLDFAYSDCAELRPDNTPNLYSPAYGWTYYVTQVGGRTVTVLKAFEPSPASFSRVWYGPNHVRAWRKSFYDKIGGHDPKREILDDHDLVARTYIQGKVLRIPKPLYLYYWTGQNTCQSQFTNPTIQTETLNIHDKYFPALVDKWGKMNGYALVDLCSDYASSPYGWHPASPKNKVDTNTYPWPFANSSIGAFRAHDFLQKQRDPIKTMEEIYRCLIPGGYLMSNTPSSEGRGADQDPTHVSRWNSNNFWYYTKRDFAKLINTKARFQLVRSKNWYPSGFHEEHDILYTYADMIALKDEAHRPPGGIEI